MRNTMLLLAVLIMISVCKALNGQELKRGNNSMVLIPAGEFIMGKNLKKNFNFKPAHEVKVDSFYMDKYEVTNSDYLLFCKETGTKLPEFWNTANYRSGIRFMDYPVIGITWRDAKKYAQWAGKRLPTEAEWEYAARGGLIDNHYPNGNEWKRAKSKQDSSGWKNFIVPVGKYDANAYGLYDMAGNVWEWVADNYGEDYYRNSPVYNPTGPDSKIVPSNKVIRGGSWHSGNMCKKVYYRKGIPNNWCDFAVGFRCVKDIK